MQAQFTQGDVVQVRSDRARVGQVLRAPARSAGEYWYQIRFMDGSQSRHIEADLQLFVAATTPEDLFATKAFGDADDLLRLVTFQKLNSPLDNTLYAAFASRTDFYPHQYKPLVKFLDSARQRLLIADEVGLGKTIEAGLIMAEMRARGELDHMLVVCPSVLRDKWREEMWRRFDEEFVVLDSNGVRALFAAYEQRGRIPHARVIMSLETIRRRDIVDLLEATALPWDLAVFDEAHHLRNNEAQSHKAAASICEGATAAVMLTATPIQLGNENLFRLLQLLDPDEFGDYRAFVERLEANEPIVEAQRIVASAFPPSIDALRERLVKLMGGRHTRFFAGDPLFERVLRTVLRNEPMTREQTARLSEDLKDLNLIGHIFTRTRKREVMTSTAIRDARVVRREMQPAERRFYDAVTAFVREQAGENLYFGGVTAQRQAASCMQACRNAFVTKALEVADDDTDAADLYLDGGDNSVPLTPSDELVAAAAALGSIDTKFDALADSLRRLEDVEPNRPVIVFAYFRATLAYLEQRLSALGFKCGVIHGGVKSDPSGKDDVRGDRIRAFRNGDFQVLLSSEVGSEGLDFQFCHIMINYDLPWNPMRVEQRIGRLDRIGQPSDRIVILTLSLKDTIEDRILTRLYNRIGIFERSLGDLEVILGEEVQELARDLLSSQLTPQEEEARIDRAYDALERRRVQLESLEQESGRFLAADQYFEEQLERARTGGEMLAPIDLKVYVERFLSRRYPESSLDGAAGGGYELHVDSQLDQGLRHLPDSTRRTRILHRVMAGKGVVRVAFDPAEARQDESVELIVGQHPLLSLATSHYRDHPEELHAVSALSVLTDEVPPGSYVYLIQEIEINGSRSIRRLEPFFVDDSLVALDRAGSSKLFGLMLRAAQAITEPMEFDEHEGRSALQQADDCFCDRLSERRQFERERAASLVQKRLTSLEISHRNRMARIEERIDNAKRNDQVRYLRMMEGQYRTAMAKYSQKVEDIEHDSALEMRARLIGCGVVRVEADNQ